MKMANVAILIDRKTAENYWKYGLNLFECYVTEILSQAGVTYSLLDHAEQIQQDAWDILIVALEANDEQTASIVWEFADSGGTVISYGGLARLASKLGCEAGYPLGVGYADISDINNEKQALRYLNAEPWYTIYEERIQRQGELHEGIPHGRELCPALLHFQVGSGSIYRWSVHIMNTVVGLQQGIQPVIKDGIPAADGTAPVDDGILKADDGIVLDWELDRDSTESGLPYFGVPYADLWREVLISHLLQVAVNKGLYLPFLDYWPEGISSVAVISHDSDANEDEAAETTLGLLKEADIQSTWCMMESGYSSCIYEQIKQDGHELAFHYNALEKDNGFWDKGEFDRQLDWLRNATGIKNIKSNKNHYTRFEGWGELFEWCESQGIQSDQTRGPSKKGNVGFLFGTCHPYFPISRWNQKNRVYDVLQIGFLTQDLDIGAWADSSVIEPFLEKVKKVRGVAHFLFHQFHLHRKVAAREAFVEVVKKAKGKGYTFWTGKQINDWIRLRRNVKINAVLEDGRVSLEAEQIPAGLVVWTPVLEDETSYTLGETEKRFGVLCKKGKYKNDTIDI